MRISDWSSDVCSSDLVPSEIRPRDRAMADRVAARLADSFRDPLSVRELAVQASVSVSKLSRTFKAVHRVTLSEYVLAARMRPSTALTRAAQLSVTQVAYDVGYDHARTFSTESRRHHGLSPTP